MRSLALLLALSAATPLVAQVAPSPDGGMSGDKAAVGRPATSSAKDGGDTASPGLPSDMHTAPPPVASKAPPTSDAQQPAPDAKSTGRAQPASETPAKPR